MSDEDRARFAERLFPAPVDHGIAREDRAGSYTEWLTLVATPTLDGTTGLPNGSESITASGIRTLTRVRTTAGGQVDESDRYFTLSSGTNTAAYAQGAGSSLPVGGGPCGRSESASAGAARSRQTR